MSSDYEYSDNEDYYDEDAEMMSVGDEDDMDMDTFNNDIQFVSKGKAKSYEVDYEPLTQRAVEDLMKSDVDHISAIFGVDVRGLASPYHPVIAPLTCDHQTDTAALLLRYMDWNKDRLIDKYMDNASAITTAAGITPPTPKSSPGPERSTRRGIIARTTRAKKPTPPPEPAHEPFVCPICY
ncbi:hypothetical protein EWM64_g6087, partial [Hericium alpestre]